MTEQKAPRLTTWQSIKAVSQSWRMGSVALLMFGSSLPLGFVWIAVPAWMAYLNVNITAIGWFGLLQAPWGFKFLWAPLLDRYPLPFLGRKRGWIFVAQLALFIVGLALAGVATHPDAIWMIVALALCMAFASATYDIAYDAYAVEVLRPEEYGMASGARVVFGRLAMLLSGGAAITLAVDYLSWPKVTLLLALCYLPMLFLTWRAPEPENLPPPPQSMREAIWEPFVGFLAQHRALEILSFVILFKLSDNLTQALLRPFFVQMGFNAFDVGVGSMLIGTIAMIAGGTAAGLLTQPLGLGRALWIFGFLQIFSNLGYAVVAALGPNRLALYAAQFVEMGTSGLGTGAYMVLLLRLTQKRFSATQYAILSSLMSITRVFTGPPAGFLVDLFGWRDFFILTLLAGVPGMVMLQRFVPWSVRDPEFHIDSPSHGAPLTPRGLVTWATLAGALAVALSIPTLAVMAGARAYTAGKVRVRVAEVTATDVRVVTRVAEGTLAGNVKTIREVTGTIPIAEFGAPDSPASGDMVTVVQEKQTSGDYVFSRRKAVDRTFDPRPRLRKLVRPQTIDDWVTTGGVLIFGALCALAVAATLAARRGLTDRQGA